MSSAKRSAMPSFRPAARFPRKTAIRRWLPGVLRTGYEISPALTPFVEVEYGHRFYDLDVDSNGFDRAADHMGARGGLEFDLGEKFAGEFSAGWVSEDLADERLASVDRAQRQRRPCLVAGSRHDRRPEGMDHGGGLDRRQRKRIDPLCERGHRRAPAARQSDGQSRLRRGAQELYRRRRPRRHPAARRPERPTGSTAMSGSAAACGTSSWTAPCPAATTRPTACSWVSSCSGRGPPLRGGPMPVRGTCAPASWIKPPARPSRNAAPATGAARSRARPCDRSGRPSANRAG